MSGHRNRILTLQALAASIPCIAAHSMSSAIQMEFRDVLRARRVRAQLRRRLLEVLHSSRALDTTLAAFVGHHGCFKGKPPRSLGAYLIALEVHTLPTLGKLSASQRRHFQSTIVDPRNRFMHEAGAFPVADSELSILLSEMHTCLAVLARL